MPSLRPGSSKSRSRSPPREGIRDERRRHRDRDRDQDRDQNRDRDRGGKDDQVEKHHRGHHDHNQRRHHHHHHHHRHAHEKDAKKSVNVGVDVELPCGARKLVRADLAKFEPLFAHYLDLQKGIDIDELDESEVRGRWKSFVGKWNRAELAHGWYEPEIFERVKAEPREPREPKAGRDDEERGSVEGGGRDFSGVGVSGSEKQRASDDDGEEGDGNYDDDDNYGPLLPGQQQQQQQQQRGGSSAARPRGPGIPTLQDIDLQRELDAEEREARRADRRQQKEQLEELVPRADAGTRERRLEKRREVNDKMRAFREPSPGGDEVAEEELVGGAEGGVADYKRMLAAEKNKLSERQMRREETSRARNAERDERIRAYKEREEGTIEKLRELARRRFG